MAVNDEVAINAALKQYYKGGKLVRIGYDDHPFYAMVKKTKLLGEYTPIVPWTDGTAGRSHSFTGAQANVSSELTVKFQVKPVRDYVLTTLDNMTIELSATDEGSYLKLMTDSVDNTARVFTRNLAGRLFRNHGGARGRIAVGGVNGNVLTLENPGDIVNFARNQRLVQSTTDGTSGALGSGNQLVTKLDQRAGTIELAATTNFLAGDYLFQFGDFGVSYHGIASWIPTTVSGADSFLGVNRSVDLRLAGNYLDATVTGQGYLEAISQMDTLIARIGGAADTVLVNPIDWNIIRQVESSRVTYFKPDVGSKAEIGFSSLKFAGQKREISIISDPDCPQKEAQVLQMDTWALGSVGGEAVKGLASNGSSPNGSKFVTLAGADGAEVRMGGYSELMCYFPGANGRVKLAT